MTEHQVKDVNDEIWEGLAEWENSPNNNAAEEILAEGLPIYYVKLDTPADTMIKEYPDGKKELIKVNDDGVVEVLKEL